MARVDPNSTLGGVRGSVAGMVVSSAVSGWYARTAVTPLRSRSFLQAQQRYFLASIAATWKALSPSARSDWATAAALPAWQRLDWFGVSYSVGGYGLFVALNMPLAMTYLTPVTSPPAATFPDPVTITAATLYRDGATVTASMTTDIAPTESAAYCRTWLSVAPLGSSAPLANRRALDFVGLATASTTFPFWHRAADLFGYPLLGQTWTVFFSTFDASGRPSAVSSFPAYCTESP